jgi:Fe-S-cluster-containing hydrogenase component 2
MCAKVCPTKAITGELKKVHVLDQSKCTHCGECHKACRVDAIAVY